MSPSGPVSQDRTARRLRAVVDAEDCATIWRASGTFSLLGCSRVSPSIVHGRPGVRALRRLGYWIDQ